MSTRDPSLARWRVATGGALVAASFILLSPGSAVPSVGFDIPYLDKVVHTTLFFVLGWLSSKSVPAQARHLVFLGVVAYGALTEGLQHYIPGRSSDLRDLAANVAGAALGVILARGRLLKRGKP